MPIIERLSSATGKRSKEINKALAQEITENDDSKSIIELVKLLEHKDRNIQSDAIEVLYETGYRKPDLIAGYDAVFVKLLENKNNRLVWGAMIAISSISRIVPEEILTALPRITKAVDNGSVITKDAGMVAYANLASVKGQKSVVLPLIYAELRKCPDKQLAQYAEKSLIAIDKDSRETFLEIFHSRLKNLEKQSQIRRVKRVIREVEKL
jgi:hypothetical protein